jgi:uncharacterized Fe-S cluster protein YjdI
MEWLSFFGYRRPINGQKIIYYGEPIGVWRGTYKIDRSDPFCEHLIFCGEGSIGGVVDRMDAPWWMPDEGQDKPQPPKDPYPKDYPFYE